MRKLKVLKFDIIHPRAYLDVKKKEKENIGELSLEQYREWLISLRSNYSDYYTYHLSQSGNFEAQEYFLLDQDYREKSAKQTMGLRRYFYKLLDYLLTKTVGGNNFYRRKVVERYINEYKPDVIFVRSHPLSSNFWRKFTDSALIVSRLSARLPRRWHPDDWDLIYTDQPDFMTFFELHGIPTIINDQGFDKRINTELVEREKLHNCIFVGGLGEENFGNRTKLFSSIAEKINFKWWGYWWHSSTYNQSMENFPSLALSYKGMTSGLEMLQIYRDSKICLNDYVDTANGIGFNQRIFEILGVGGFMLTRHAENFKDIFPNDIFITFHNDEDCIDKIHYYLKNDKERYEISKAAQKFIAEQYDYSRIGKEFANDIEKYYKLKFSL